MSTSFLSNRGVGRFPRPPATPHCQLKAHRAAPSRGSAVRGPRVVVRASSSDDEQGSAAPPVALPLFPLPNVLHPAQTGVLRVFEPRFLSLFRDQPQGATWRFGHVLAPYAGPPALLDAFGAVGGLPAVGVYARVTQVTEVAGGDELLVRYEGVRRFRLRAVDDASRPYPLAAVQWYDDELAGLAPGDRDSVDEAERELMGLLSEVQRLSSRLGVPLPSSEADDPSSSPAGGAKQLPAAVLRYSPPPRVRMSTADYMRAAGMPAGEKIAVWQRHGSVYGGPAGGRKEAAADPYQHLREAVAKDRRQELFSFAAANCLELGVVERLALLMSQDTAARLAYVEAAVRPYLSDLAARVAVKGALGA